MSGALDLDAIEARANAATEGPWEAMCFDSDHSKYEFSCSVITEDVGDSVCGFDALGRLGNERHAKDDGWHDAQFIAAARTDVPALVARVRELEAAVERVEALKHAAVKRSAAYGIHVESITLRQLTAALNGDRA